MKKFTLAMAVAFALCAGAAVAQMSGGSQGTQQSSPSMSGPRGQQQPGTNQPDQNTQMGGQTDQTSGKSERKLKGCVQSQGGQYVLETKKGKEVALSGQDVSAHVGHEVAVKGNFASGSMSQSSTSGSEKTFNVSSVDMISDSCSGGKTKGSSSMGNSSMGTGTNGTNPNGTGTGSSNPSSTTPPQ